MSEATKKSVSWSDARDPLLAGLLCALSSLVILAVSEALRAPLGAGQGAWAGLPIFFLFALNGASSVLWMLVAYPVAQALLLVARRAFPAHRRALLVAQLLVSAGAVLVCYLKLVEYSRFVGYIPFMALHLAVLAIIISGFHLLPDPAPAAAPSRLKAFLGTKAILAVAIIAFVALHLLNYALYYDSYPTLHASVLMLSFLLLQTGSFHAALSLVRRARAKTGIIAAISFLAALVAASIPISGVLASHARRADFSRFTIVGQELSRRTWEAATDANSRRGEGAFDPEGVARFREQSGLPPLPDDFDLLDHNILLVSVEAFRADETSMNNPERNLTPHLLDYAKSGAHWFTRAYAGAAYTVQSIASLFTMAYPSASGLQIFEARWSGYLGKEHPAVPDQLEEAGYDTFWVAYSGGAGEEGHLGWCWPRFASVECLGPDKEILKAAKKELRKRKGAFRPFFGWVFFPAPHAPYVAHYDDMPKKTERDRYRQELRYVDGIIDELLDYLEETGLDDNTIVIIHGDHGEELKDHGKGGHESLYSECTNVPLIVRIPGVDGARSDTPTSLVYVFPWLFSNGNAELKAAAREKIERVFGPVLEATDGAVVSEIFGAFGTRSLLAYQDHHFHHDFASGHNELYDLREDPGEKRNLFGADRALSDRYLDRFNRYAKVREKILNVSFSAGTADEQESAQERQARKEAVGKLHGASEGELLATLRQSDSWQIRREAITLLCARPSLEDQTIDEVIAMLADENWELRRRTKNNLRDSKTSGLDARLLNALRSDNPLRGRSYVYGGERHTMAETIETVLTTRKAKPMAATIAALESDDVELLRYATRAVGAHSSKAAAALPRLTALAEHPDPTVRKNAKESHERISDAVDE